MNTCKNCFVKYDSKGIKDGLFSQYPNFEFCSSVCASAKREAHEQQRNSEKRATEFYEHQQREQARVRNYQSNENQLVSQSLNNLTEEDNHQRRLEETRISTLKINNLTELGISIIGKKNATVEEIAWLEKVQSSQEILMTLKSSPNHEINITALTLVVDSLISTFPNSDYRIERVIPKIKKDIFDDF